MFRRIIKLTLECPKSVVSGLQKNVQVRRFSEFYSRQPSKVVNEDEINKFYEEFEQGPKDSVPKIEKRKPLDPKLKKKVYNPDNLPKLKNHGTYKYRELEEDSGILTSLMMSVRSRKERTKNGRIILEGERLINDAVRAGAVLETVVFSRLYDADKLHLRDDVLMYKVPYRAISTWSTLVTPPGLMGVFKIPDTEKTLTSNPLPLTIVCDNVRDPGNMGAILRGAAAVGCKKVITVKGCVDIWDSKVLKTGAGSHFKVPIFTHKSWSDVMHLTEISANYLIADNKTFRVNDEMLEQYDNESEDETETDKKTDNSKSENSDIFEEIDESMPRKERVKLCNQLAKQIPIIPYYSMQYELYENVIIVGGETEGISLNALNMVRNRSGVRVNIPMSNEVESLNTGMALGIIMFEVKKQTMIEEASKSLKQKKRLIT